MKKKFARGISIIVSALLIVISCVVDNVPTYANAYSSIVEYLEYYDLPIPDGLNSNYEHYLTYDYNKRLYVLIGIYDDEYEVELGTLHSSGSFLGDIKGLALQFWPSDYVLDGAYCYYLYKDLGEWYEWDISENLNVYGNWYRHCAIDTDGDYSPINLSDFILFSCKDISIASSYLVEQGWTSGVVFGANGVGGVVGEVFNPNLGYLQNISRKSTYIRGALYNYDEDSLTYHWYHDTTSSSGIDLTSGNYIVRHYISMATVTGYGKSDIVEMSDKYLMAEFDASQGYYTYLDLDYDKKMESLGFEGLGVIEKYINGYFLLEHHYFQIVNLDTNEVGGYVHLYPENTTDSFGVELNYEGLNENFEVDEDLSGGVIDDVTGSGLTQEDALENADEPKLDNIDGVDQFISSIESYSSQISNVSQGIGALIGALPPWVLGTFGLCFGMLVLCILIKVLRG